MWEIYAYQNADSLFGVFNAAAAIHASGDYLSAVAAVAFCGFVAALIAQAIILYIHFSSIEIAFLWYNLIAPAIVVVLAMLLQALLPPPKIDPSA